MSFFRNVHLIGLGGIGMSGLAHLLYEAEASTSGCDKHLNAITRTLSERGIPVCFGHDHVLPEDCQCLVYTSAVSQAHPEIKQAKARGLAILKRAECLAKIITHRQQLMVTGTHGKSTTTAWIAWIFEQAMADIGFYIGGLCPNFEYHARLGQSDVFIFEADESDDTLMCYRPQTLLVTNLEADHLDRYDFDFKNLQAAIKARMWAMPENGQIFINGDDPILRACSEGAPCEVITFGLHPSNRFVLQDIRYDSAVSATIIDQAGHLPPLSFQSSLFGRHNLLNALAAVAVAHVSGIEPSAIQAACASFKGVKRRQDIVEAQQVSNKTVTLVHDYGHHPSAIRVLHEALSLKYPGRRLIWIYEPHRYTRTQLLFDDFVASLSLADEVILLNVYAASESCIPTATSEYLAGAISEHTQKHVVACSAEQANHHIEKIVENDDIIVMQGAGNIIEVGSLI